jgi:hypothetical protein
MCLAELTTYATLVRNKFVLFHYTYKLSIYCLLFEMLLSILSKDKHLITHIEVGLVYLACTQM